MKVVSQFAKPRCQRVHSHLRAQIQGKLFPEAREGMNGWAMQSLGSRAEVDELDRLHVTRVNWYTMSNRVTINKPIQCLYNIWYEAKLSSWLKWMPIKSYKSLFIRHFLSFLSESNAGSTTLLDKTSMRYNQMTVFLRFCTQIHHIMCI